MSSPEPSGPRPCEECADHGESPGSATWDCDNCGKPLCSVCIVGEAFCESCWWESQGATEVES
jgi:hypothetical protein